MTVIPINNRARVRELEDAIRAALICLFAGRPDSAETHLRRALGEEDDAA